MSDAFPGALVLDNSIYKSLGYHFNNGLLAQLGQFKDQHVRVLQTDIVHNEAVKHISDEIAETLKSIDKALNGALRKLDLNADNIQSAKELLKLHENEVEISERRLREFYQFNGIELIEAAKYVDISDVLDKYFSLEAPFENSKDKKHEFPDAIALLTIEGWAQENDINVIAVSLDRGWLKYSEFSERITVVAALDEALNQLQPHVLSEKIVSFIRKACLLDGDNEVLTAIEEAVISRVEEIEIYCEADSYLYYELGQVYAKCISYEMNKNKEGLVEFSILNIKERLTLQLRVMVELEVEADFDLYATDYIDKDYVGVGSVSLVKSLEHYFDVIVYFDWNGGSELSSFEFMGIEISIDEVCVDFGEIHPS